MYFAKNERTIIEKIRESIGAVSIETTERKDEILKKYLNSLYF